MDNTSGQGKAAVVPQEVKGLAWGAFFWSFIWGLFNRTWVALLTLVPIIGLVVWVMLLFKGREWAWRNKRWDSVEHFNKVQRRWAKAGLITLCAPFLLGIIAAIVIPMMGNKAEQNVSNAPPPALPPVTSTAKKAAAAAVSAPAPNTVLTSPVAGSAEPDFDNLLGPALTGLEKPGTTRAGPAILELSQFMGDSIWIKLHLPLIKDFDIAPAPEITVNSVSDASGQNYYDGASNFETEFFRRVGISRDSSPITHFSGLRTVRIKPGLNEQALQKIEGQVHIAIPVDVKMVAFETNEVGKEKTVHGRTIELKSLSGNKAVLHYQSTSKNMFGGVRGYDKGGAPVEIKMRQGSVLSGDTQIDFKAPVSKIEVLSATNVIERQFPFTLVRGAVAEPVLPATASTKPSVSTHGVAAALPEPAKPVFEANELDAIYAKFHSAGLTANFNEMLKYGTSSPELESMPAAKRQEMLNLLAQMIPKSYSVAGKTIAPDGNHATLHLTAPGAVTGTATLIKEKGGWKVDKVNWGGSPQTSEPSSSMATDKEMGTKAKSKPVMHAKMNEPPAPTVTALVVAAPEPQKKVITTKFNDVFTAVMYRDLPAVKELLELGWWVDKPDPAGTTPLMAAVKIDDPAIAKLLLEHGANPNIFARGDSALRLAKRSHNAAMVALLQHYGASVE